MAPALLGGESSSPDSPAPKTTSTNSDAAAPAPRAETALPSWIQLGGQFRGRVEAPNGIGFADKDDAYMLTRSRVNLRIRPTKWLQFYAEAQDSRAFGYDKPVPASAQDSLDLRLAYAELNYEGKRSVLARVGRQEVALGGGRLIGSSDWSNFGKQFDGARLAIFQKGARVDLFTMSPVQADDSRFDRHKPGEHVHGAYFTLSSLMPGASIEPYFMMKRQMRMTGERGDLGNLTLNTAGWRIAGKLPYRFDYSAELARQFGHSARDHVSAMAGAYVAGWTVSKAKWKPRVSAEFDHASGDAANKDGQRGTFDQLYPSNHSQYGIADQVGWRNMRTARLGFDAVLRKKLKVQGDWNNFYLANVQDGLYNDSGTRVVLNRKATSKHVGNELDMIGTYQHSKTLTFGGGLGYLIAGQYLKQSTNGYSNWLPFAFCTRTF